MAGGRHERVAFDERIESVTALGGIYGARKLNGAEHIRRKSQADPLELALQETVIEVRVVRDEKPAVHPFEQIGGEFLEGQRIAHHVVRDAGQLLDERWNRLAGIDERCPLRHACGPTSTIPISVIRSIPKVPPVVSKSTKTSGVAGRIKSGGRSSCIVSGEDAASAAKSVVLEVRRLLILTPRGFCYPQSGQMASALISGRTIDFGAVRVCTDLL